MSAGISFVTGCRLSGRRRVLPATALVGLAVLLSLLHGGVARAEEAVPSELIPPGSAESAPDELDLGIDEPTVQEPDDSSDAAYYLYRIATGQTGPCKDNK